MPPLRPYRSFRPAILRPCPTQNPPLAASQNASAYQIVPVMIGVDAPPGITADLAAQTQPPRVSWIVRAMSRRKLIIARPLCALRRSARLHHARLICGMFERLDVLCERRLAPQANLGRIGGFSLGCPRCPSSDSIIAVSSRRCRRLRFDALRRPDRTRCPGCSP
jgi:hypothetical protein